MLHKVFGTGVFSRFFSHLAAVVMALALNAGQAWAQTDPPARVGRLAYIEDGVVFHADRNDPGTGAAVNWPVTSGNRLETRRPGRAEVWIGSTGYRLADNSQAEFLAVDDEQVAIRLDRGSLTISVLDRDQVDDIEVVLPDARVRFQTPGRYRFDVLPDFSALSVQAGHASFDKGRQVMPVVAGQRYVSARDGREGLEAMGLEDNFDRWVAARENAGLAGLARRYVSPRMSGYQDLDAWGEWQSVPEYGAVWYPLGVGIDWAPYRYGRWAWINPWGWTWIDAAPWGFAPFHYGRWVLLGGRWGWVPGQHVARPVYAPALVGWAGRPDRGFYTGRTPPTGWFPLAPREVYVPAYRHSPDYVRQMNRAHVQERAHIDQALRRPDERRFLYRQQPGAVTNVPLEPRREFRAPPGTDMNRENRRDFGNREPERDSTRTFRHEPDREPRPDVRPLPPDAVRTTPRQRMERQGDASMPAQSAPTLRIMPPQSPAPAAQPLGQPPLPSASRPVSPTPPPTMPAIQAVPQISAPPTAVPQVQPMPERRREFRELQEHRPGPPAAIQPVPQTTSPSPMPGGQMQGREFRGGPPQAQPAERPAGERRGDRPGRDHDEGRGPR